MTPATFTRFAGPNWETDPWLLPWLPTVDTWFRSESVQHPMRRWEYASALCASSLWRIRGGVRARTPRALDVGGAGSPLHRMLAPHCLVTVVDPALSGGTTIEEWHGSAVECLFSISVLEHVEDPYDFLGACDRHLLPGGLLFLTVDAWDPPVEDARDTAHFHWMRKRIFTRTSVQHVMEFLQGKGFRPFGEVDLEYRGNTVFNYTFASLAMVKEG